RGLVALLAFAQVEQEAARSVEPLEELARVLRIDVGDPGQRVVKCLVLCLLDVADRPEVILLDAGVAGQRDPLRGRRPAEQAFGLDVADDRLAHAGGPAEYAHRPADRAAIDRTLRPPVAIGELLRDGP